MYGHGLGSVRHIAGRHIQLGRHDGCSILSRSIRGCVRKWYYAPQHDFFKISLTCFIGIPFLLSFFYKRNELGFRCGLYLSSAPLATCFAGALAYGITSGNPHGIAAWRLLFLVEGLPCLVAAVATWFLMPDSPETARFLNAEEQAAAKERSIRKAGNEVESRLGKVHWSEVKAALCDLKVGSLFDCKKTVLTSNSSPGSPRLCTSRATSPSPLSLSSSQPS